MDHKNSKIKLTSYISINGWMISNLPKVGVSTMNEVMIFAIIYSYSKEPDTMFTGALPYLINQSLTSRTTCIKILNKLTELQLIFKKEDGQRNYYYVNQLKLTELQNDMPEFEASIKLNQSKTELVQNPNQTGTESELDQSNFRTELVQNPNQTGTETAPNNIIYNTNNKINNIAIKKKQTKINLREYLKLFEQNNWLDRFKNNRDKRAMRKWLTYLQEKGSTLKVITPSSWEIKLKKIIAYCDAGNDLMTPICNSIERGWDNMNLNEEYQPRVKRIAVRDRILLSRKNNHNKYRDLKSKVTYTQKYVTEEKKLQGFNGLLKKLSNQHNDEIINTIKERHKNEYEQL